MKFKKEIIIVGVAVIAFSGFLLYGFWKERSIGILKENNPYLTSEERALALGKFEEAKKKLREAANDDEKFGAYMDIGFQYSVFLDYENAKKSFEKAADIKPDNYVAYVALYQVEADMKDNESARNNIKKAVSLREDNPDLWKKYIQFESERFSADKETLDNLYREALKKTGPHVDILGAYAQFLETNGDLAAALEQWKKANAQYPSAAYEQEINRLESLFK